MTKIIFETTDENTIELYNDYRFLKYYKEHVIDDIYKNVIKFNKITYEDETKDVLIIQNHLNKLEYQRYMQIIQSRDYIDILYCQHGAFGNYIYKYNEYDPNFIEYMIFGLKHDLKNKKYIN